MVLSICIRCGSSKRRPASKCRTCGFDPIDDKDKAKSLILSLAYEIDGEYRGKTKKELNVIAAAIRDGHPYVFDVVEVQSVVEYARRVLGIPARRLIADGLKWLFPPIAILVVIYILL
jgi:ribosomal protein L40E